MKTAMRTTTLQIEPAWRQRLGQAGLNDWTDFVTCRTGECLSTHERSQTSRLILPDGQPVFLKIDHFTKFKTALYSLLHGRTPRTNTEHEREIYRQLRADGFIVPDIIAWGAERRWGMPHRGFMVSLPLDGTPLDRYVLQESRRDRRETAIRACQETLQLLLNHGYDWHRDCKPEHFFVLRDGSIGLIDLERAEKRRTVSATQRTRQQQRFDTLLRCAYPDLPARTPP